MPRYHFHLCGGGRITENVEDGEWPDLDTARDRAVTIARHLISDDVLAGRLCLAGMILITDDNQRTVGQLLFRNAVTVEGL